MRELNPICWECFCIQTVSTRFSLLLLVVHSPIHSRLTHGPLGHVLQLLWPTALSLPLQTWQFPCQVLIRWSEEGRDLTEDGVGKMSFQSRKPSPQRQKREKQCYYWMSIVIEYGVHGRRSIKRLPRQRSHSFIEPSRYNPLHTSSQDDQ